MVADTYKTYKTMWRSRERTPALAARRWNCAARRPKAPKSAACRLSDAVTRFAPSLRWAGVMVEFAMRQAPCPMTKVAGTKSVMSHSALCTRELLTDFAYGVEADEGRCYAARVQRREIRDIEEDAGENEVVYEGVDGWTGHYQDCGGDEIA
jgi:hypothetical protein